MKPCGGRRKPFDLRTEVAHTARVYDYVLGGKTNYAADREVASKLMAIEPGPLTAMRENRAFMHRVVRELAGRGVRQFLDVGTGIPTSPNLHEVAQSVAPEARVVYVDNDPIVLAHARALLASAPRGRTAYLEAPVQEPEQILNSPMLKGTLDLDEPVAVTLIAILHFLPPDPEPREIVRRLLEPLPAGSYLAVSHMTADFAPRAVRRGAQVYNSAAEVSLHPADRAEMEAFFDGLDLLDPGVVPLHRWHPDGPVTVEDEVISMYGAVGRKP
ncbi:methyltransferase [Wenjunlia vitaminophila]|uniref:Methyltransferase n=2 Tax=Wenjunlia vitaminophila TaxID=76728 RepID=A0A0T6LL81_WENVI|nr:methyltransferase [Wenjunlia vitaminophila]